MLDSLKRKGHLGSAMDALYILAFLFVALLVFVYFENRQYIKIIEHLTSELSALKAFSLGAPPREEPYKVTTLEEIERLADEDFGEVAEDEEGEGEMEEE